MENAELENRMQAMSFSENEYDSMDEGDAPFLQPHELPSLGHDYKHEQVKHKFKKNLSHIR